MTVTTWGSLEDEGHAADQLTRSSRSSEGTDSRLARPPRKARPSADTGRGATSRKERRAMRRLTPLRPRVRAAAPSANGDGRILLAPRAPEVGARPPLRTRRLLQPVPLAG